MGAAGTSRPKTPTVSQCVAILSQKTTATKTSRKMRVPRCIWIRYEQASRADHRPRIANPSQRGDYDLRLGINAAQLGMDRRHGLLWKCRPDGPQSLPR